MPRGTPLRADHNDAIHKDLAWLEMQKVAIAARHGVTLSTLDKIDKVQLRQNVAVWTTVVGILANEPTAILTGTPVPAAPAIMQK